MAQKAPKLDLRFLVRIDKSSSGDFGKFTARLVYIEDGKVRHPSSTWAGSFEAPYSDFVVTAQCDRTYKYGHEAHKDWYGMEWGYEDGSHAITLQRAEVMVKFLRRLETKLDKVAVEEGNWHDLPTLFLRVAAALGVTKFAMTDSYSGDRYGQPMVDDYAWQTAPFILRSMDAAHKDLVGA